MKKLYLGVFAIIAFTHFSYAQNTAWPSTTSADNVGIGTVSPAEKLNITGNIRADGTYPYLNLYSNSWTANSYIQNGVDPIGLGAGNYLSFLNPLGKGFAFSEGSTNVMTINPSGNVGIGTTAPSAMLQIGNNAVSTTVHAQLGFASYDNTTSLPQIVLNNPASNFNAIGYDSTTGGMVFGTVSTINGTSFVNKNLTILQNGDVAIGTNDPKGYKLSVAGNVIAEQVTVKLQTNWPDYVFKKNYNLTPLSQLKTYIDQNHHLPELPSQQQIAKDGLNLGEMNKLLVKKVEELTLYLIELKAEKDKQLKAQNDINQILQDQLKQIQNQLNGKGKTKS